MANFLYKPYKEALLSGASDASLLSNTVKLALIDTALYTPSSLDAFLTSASAGIVGTPQPITSKSVTNGIFSGANVVFSAVTGASVEGLLFYIDTGTASTSRLVAFLDSGIGNFPFTPNGGDVTIDWEYYGIFEI